MSIDHVSVSYIDVTHHAKDLFNSKVNITKNLYFKCVKWDENEPFPIPQTEVERLRELLKFGKVMLQATPQERTLYLNLNLSFEYADRDSLQIESVGIKLAVVSDKSDPELIFCLQDEPLASFVDNLKYQSKGLFVKEKHDE